MECAADKIEELSDNDEHSGDVPIAPNKAIEGPAT
jgi:hypothetical protein